MRLLLVNPNTTATMTAAIAASASSVALPDTVVETCNPVTGPASIEDENDERDCVPGLLEIVTTAHARPESTRPDAYVVACFGDPGLAEVRSLVDVPALGIAQAAMHTAVLTAGTFSVVTSMRDTVPRAWQLADHYTPSRCLAVYACDIPVLQIDADPSSIEPIGELCARTLERDGSGAIVLGCAAMARFAAPLARRLGAPVIDGVTAATLLAEALTKVS